MPFKGFADNGQWEFFGINATAVVTGALVGEVLLFREQGFICLAVASATQLVPAGCLIAALVGFLQTPTADDLRTGLINLGIKGLLTSTSLVEGLLEALVSSKVQTHALVHTCWQEKEEQQRTNLLLSVSISLLSMTYALAKLDKR